MRSSNAFDFVVPSFFERFLKLTTTFAFVIDVRFGGSVRYDSELPGANDPKPPKPPPAAPNATRLLEACDLNCRLLIVT